MVCAMNTSLAAAIHAELKSFVKMAGTLRSLPTTCHVGHPGSEHAQWVHGAADDDPALRADLVERAIDGLLVTDGACAWVTRGGELKITDADAEWFAATRMAFERHGLRLPAFFVLNRSGWLDLVTDERRQWTRVRNRARPSENAR
jgi:hypothetical protein